MGPCQWGIFETGIKAVWCKPGYLDTHRARLTGMTNRDAERQVRGPGEQGERVWNGGGSEREDG